MHPTTLPPTPTWTSQILSCPPVKAQLCTCKHSGRKPMLQTRLQHISSQTTVHWRIETVDLWQSWKRLDWNQLGLLQDSLALHCPLAAYRQVMQHRSQTRQNRDRQTGTTILLATSWMSSQPEGFRARSTVSTTERSLYSRNWSFQNDWCQHPTSHRPTWGLLQPCIK